MRFLSLPLFSLSLLSFSALVPAVVSGDAYPVTSPGNGDAGQTGWRTPNKGAGGEGAELRDGQEASNGRCPRQASTVGIETGFTSL